MRFKEYDGSNGPFEYITGNSFREDLNVKIIKVGMKVRSHGRLRVRQVTPMTIIDEID